MVIIVLSLTQAGKTRTISTLLGPSKSRLKPFINIQFLSLETFLSFHTNQCEERPVLSLLLLYITAEPNNMQSLRDQRGFL